jgi:hypothetical protein
MESLAIESFTIGLKTTDWEYITPLKKNNVRHARNNLGIKV